MSGLQDDSAQTLEELRSGVQTAEQAVATPHQELNLDALRQGVHTAEQRAAEVATDQGQPWSPELVYTLGGAVLLFGLLMSLIMGWLVKGGRPSDQVLRTFCVPLIVVAAVFLVVVGYNQDQIAPVIGLLGTIAGYLLGKSNAPVDQSQEEARGT